MIDNELDTDTKNLIDNATKLIEENKRLNNIINKIRNWLEEDYKSTINNEVCDYSRYYLDTFEKILKGSNDNA